MDVLSSVLPSPAAPPKNRGRTTLEAMYRIIGTDKVTNRVVDVAVADNDAEKRMILRQEARNYYDLRAIPLRMSYQAFYAAEMA